MPDKASKARRHEMVRARSMDTNLPNSARVAWAQAALRSLHVTPIRATRPLAFSIIPQQDEDRCPDADHPDSDPTPCVSRDCACHCRRAYRFSAVRDTACGGRRSPLRPVLRYAPRTGFMKDPNGLVFYDGERHLLYRYKPIRAPGRAPALGRRGQFQPAALARPSDHPRRDRGRAGVQRQRGIRRGHHRRAIRSGQAGPRRDLRARFARIPACARCWTGPRACCPVASSRCSRSGAR